MEPSTDSNSDFDKEEEDFLQSDQEPCLTCSRLPVQRTTRQANRLYIKDIVEMQLKPY